MKATYKIQQPEKIECTLTITMSVKEWEELSDQLTQSWPSWDLARIINSVTREARMTIYGEAPKEPA